ncbi:MAG TPA: YegP family protein [Pyrinomonadaceae bacterium]|nr:YegP family protein [Pyrinomonadaceae bacterium]
MTYIYYKDQKGEWRWRLKAANGRILADSGEGYNSESECLADIDRVKGSRDATVKKE